jgi:hypothetical protein
MKHLAISILILFVSVQTFAQQNDTQRYRYLGKAEKYKKMQSAGTALTIVGGVLTIVGVITVANSSIDETTDSYGYTTTDTKGHPVLGAFSILGGGACLGAGIPLMIIGGKKHRQYSDMAESVSLKFNANPKRGAGITLTYRF